MKKKLALCVDHPFAWVLKFVSGPALFAGALSVGMTAQTITEVAKLTASDGSDDDRFGLAVSISDDRAIVGSLDDDFGNRSGAAYVFEFGPSGWVEQAKLTASDGAAGDRFGTSVSISGNRAVVGSPMDIALGDRRGSAYVFEFGPSGWVEQAKLTASDGTGGDGFGWSVSISGDHVIVSATFDREFGFASGSAYVFELGPTGWVEQAKLIASNGQMYDRFGYSVSISGDHAIVGAAGFRVNRSPLNSSAYIFERGPSGWMEQAQVTVPDGVDKNWFGASVAISGDRALVGAPFDDERAINSGAAYVFERGPSGWVQQAKLTASDGDTADLLGTSVAISDDRAIACSIGDDDLGDRSGSAYVFEFGPSGWVEKAKLTASDGDARDLFGYSVGISGERALVGADREDEGGLNAGAAYVFELDLAAASCTTRNGILGLNPPDFTCTSLPKLGTTWTSEIASTPLIGQVTIQTIMAIGLAGPVEGMQAFGFELLVLPPFDQLDVSTSGSHAFPVPSSSSLAGIPYTAQGLRLEMTGGTNIFVLTNALDLVLGL